MVVMTLYPPPSVVCLCTTLYYIDLLCGIFSANIIMLFSYCGYSQIFIHVIVVQYFFKVASEKEMVFTGSRHTLPALFRVPHK